MTVFSSSSPSVTQVEGILFSAICFLGFFCLSRCVWALGWKLEWRQVLWVAFVISSSSCRRWKRMRLQCVIKDPLFPSSYSWCLYPFGTGLGDRVTIERLMGKEKATITSSSHHPEHLALPGHYKEAAYWVLIPFWRAQHHPCGPTRGVQDQATEISILDSPQPKQTKPNS